MKKSMMLLVVCMLFAGCASTKGRFVLADINGWEPPQMTASTPEDISVYKCDTPTNMMMAPAPGMLTPFYEFIADIIKAVKGIRIRVLNVEWNECK